MTSFTGKTILITRSKESSAELRSLLEGRGASVISFPTIEIRDPESWESCDRAIWKLAEYESVCFTSKNSVIKFIERIRLLRPQAVDTLAARNIFAVGEKTKAVLESSGFSITAAPAHASAKELTALVQSHQIQNAAILFPKGNLAGTEFPDQLRSLGARVEEIIVYRTMLPEPEQLEETRQALLSGVIDAAAFFSPSSIINFTEMISAEILTRIPIAVIGSTTAEAVRQLGLSVSITAPEATTASLAAALEHYFTTSRNDHQNE